MSKIMGRFTRLFHRGRPGAGVSLDKPRFCPVRGCGQPYRHASRHWGKHRQPLHVDYPTPRARRMPSVQYRPLKAPRVLRDPAVAARMAEYRKGNVAVRDAQHVRNLARRVR